VPEFASVAHLELDHLLPQLVARAQDVMVVQGRLRGLLRANQAVAGDLSLPAVLRHIVEAARDLVGARYAALGVVGHGRLVEFVHVGMDDAVVGAIGHLPAGHGILGLLIRDPRPLRLPDLTAHEASCGFPAGHPPMRSLLGVPIRIGDQVFGHLYLTGKVEEAEFTADDEELVVALAASAAMAIDNARLFAEAERRQRWLTASAEITRTLLDHHATDAYQPGHSPADTDAEGVDPDERAPLGVIARLARGLADAATALIMVPDDPEHLVVRAVSGPPTLMPIGSQSSIDESLSGEVLRTGTTRCADDATRLPGAFRPSAADLGPIMLVPLQAADQVLGVLGVARHKGEPPFAEAEVEVAAGFAAQAALALQLADAHAQAGEAAPLLAILEDRDRIARDLHDLVIRRLYSAGLSLHSLARRYIPDPEGQRALAAQVDQLDQAIHDLRTTVFGLQSEHHAPPADAAEVLTPKAGPGCV
jgi:GAF domain-containing protein